MTEQHLESTITAVAARCLKSRASLDPGMSFELLGLDSLATIELAAALEEELGCELPPDVLVDCTDAKSLAARLARQGITARVREDPFERMFADAVLPADVRPAGRVRHVSDLRAAQRILLTGSTGFLGRALVEELLRSTSATIVCLVRSNAGRLQPAHDNRLQCITGDLTHPQLGLSGARYESLAHEIDAIVHCGAAVNWVFGYGALRGVNVLGTLELLRLACRANASFHFISSLSACYSTEGPRTADETFDGLHVLRGVHLGYAQTKIVAEALVRTAGDRGLPVRIYRPALISGHSATGSFNRDDLITALVRGCVEMGTASDLDWNLDCVPVDQVASEIVQLSGETGPVFHLGPERPRHWRECALWMRMYGYPIRLVSYHEWLRQLDSATRPDRVSSAIHPLRALRSFFLDRPSGARGLTLPEVYEECRRTQADGSATRTALRNANHRNVPLDACLLERYFAAFRSAGELPDPPSKHRQIEPVVASDLLDKSFYARLLDRPITGVEVLETGSDHSIVSELTAWRSNRTTGLFRTRVTDAAGCTRVVLTKVKAHGDDVIAVGEALADLVDPAVGRQYRRFSDRLGFASSHAREIAIYRQQDPRFLRHAPRLLGSITDDPAQIWAAALEFVDDAPTAQCAGDARWRSADVERALDGLAALHAIWIGRETELCSQPWLGFVQSADVMSEMSGLWRALADHAAPLFSSWTDRDLVQIHQQLVSRIGQWWPALETGPRTLIHNDFNPRNICLRGPRRRLCAYDWELATLGAPQHDLAELLCFTLPANVTRDDVMVWVDRYRKALESETGLQIDRSQWIAGFRSSIYDLLINRLSIYAVVHRVRRQQFLPGVMRSWRNLYRLFPLDHTA